MAQPATLAGRYLASIEVYIVSRSLSVFTTLNESTRAGLEASLALSVSLPGCSTSHPQVCTRLVKEAVEAGASILALPECFSFIGVSITAAHPLR